MDSTAMSEFLLQKWRNLTKRSFELLTDGNAIDESMLTSLAVGQGWGGFRDSFPFKARL
jgi:hypothetical protein